MDRDRETARIEAGRKAYYRWMQKQKMEDELMRKDKMKQR